MPISDPFQVQERAEGFFQDLLTRGGRRTHAWVAILATATMCACCLILCLGAVKLALSKTTPDKASFGSDLQIMGGAAFACLSALVASIYKSGKAASVEMGKTPPPAPPQIHSNPNP
jgi:biotin transporter BioY